MRGVCLSGSDEVCIYIHTCDVVARARCLIVQKAKKASGDF